MNDPADAPRSLEDLLGELVESEAPSGGHPAAARLLDYHAGRLGPGEEATLREHLAGCRACTRVLLDLAGFDDAGAEEEGGEAAPDPGRFEAAAAWRALAPRLEGEERARRRSGRWLPWAAAAALLVASAGLGWRVGDLARERAALEDRLAALGAPQPDLPVLYLDQPTRGEAAAAGPTVELAPEGYLALVVLPPPEPWHERYRVEVAEEDTGTVWSGTLVPSPEGGLRLGLPARLLPPGEYRVRLSAPAPAGPGEPPLAVSPLTVTRAGE
jgi:hypothetical protein